MYSLIARSFLRKQQLKLSAIEAAQKLTEYYVRLLNVSLNTDLSFALSWVSAKFCALQPLRRASKLSLSVLVCCSADSGCFLAKASGETGLKSCEGPSSGLSAPGFASCLKLEFRMERVRREGTINESSGAIRD